MPPHAVADQSSPFYDGIVVPDTVVLLVGAHRPHCRPPLAVCVQKTSESELRALLHAMVRARYNHHADWTLHVHDRCVVEVERSRYKLDPSSPTALAMVGVMNAIQV